MYAVIRTGGKQYRVTAGDILEVEKLTGDIGDTVTLEDVLLVSNGDDTLVGQPNVDDASVTAKITGQYRGKKILAFRYRPKKRIRVRKGHRQYVTRLEIESINAAGQTFVASAATSTAARATTTSATAASSPSVEEPATEETAAAPHLDDTIAAADTSADTEIVAQEPEANAEQEVTNDDTLLAADTDAPSGPAEDAADASDEGDTESDENTQKE